MNLYKKGYTDILTKLAVEESSGLPWWTPLAAAGAAGLGAYGLSRIPFRASAKFPGLRKIRDLAKGRMSRTDIVEREGVSPETLSKWEKFKRQLLHGPEKEWDVLARDIESGKGSRVAWQGSELPVEGTINPVYGSTTRASEQGKIYDFLKRMEDKLEEARFLEKYAPGTSARTLDIGDVLSKYNLKLRKGKNLSGDLSRLQEALNKEFGKGYIIKTRAMGKVDPGAASSGVFPTNKTDLVRAFEDWKLMKSEFMRAKRTAPTLNTAMEQFRTKPGFEGRVIDEMLARNAIIQERLPLETYGKELSSRMKAMGQAPTKEYRVHTIGGQAVPYLAMPRYGAVDPRMVSQYLKAREAAEWAQKNVINKLPQAQRELSYGMDIAPLEGGGFKVIELNTGGSSGLLANPLGSHLLHRAVTGRFSRPAAAMLGGGAALAGGTAGGVATALSGNKQPNMQQQQLA